MCVAAAENSIMKEFLAVISNGRSLHAVVTFSIESTAVVVDVVVVVVVVVVVAAAILRGNNDNAYDYVGPFIHLILKS